MISIDTNFIKNGEIFSPKQKKAIELKKQIINDAYKTGMVVMSDNPCAAVEAYKASGTDFFVSYDGGIYKKDPAFTFDQLIVDLVKKQIPHIHWDSSMHAVENCI